MNLSPNFQPLRADVKITHLGYDYRAIKVNLTRNSMDLSKDSV